MGVVLVVGAGVAAAVALRADEPASTGPASRSTAAAAAEPTAGTTAGPEPGPILSSPELSERAIAVVAERHGVDARTLIIGNTARATLPLTGVEANAFKLYSDQSGENFQVYLDDSGREMDFEQLFRAEEAARNAKFGKLTPGLSESVAGGAPNERFAVQVIPVADHSAPVDGEPMVGSPGAPGSANPMTAEEIQRLTAARNRQTFEINVAATEPIVERLEAMGLRVESNASIAWISVELTAEEITIVAAWPDVLGIGSAASSENTPAARAD